MDCKKINAIQARKISDESRSVIEELQGVYYNITHAASNGLYSCKIKNVADHSGSETDPNLNIESSLEGRSKIICEDLFNQGFAISFQRRGSSVQYGDTTYTWEIWVSW